MSLMLAILLVACTGRDDSSATPDATPRVTEPASTDDAPEFDYSLSIAARRVERSTGVDFGALIEDTMARVAGELPGTLGSVYVETDPGKAIPGFGIGGYTSSAGATVFIYLDPRHVGSAQQIETKLPELLAHELDHSIRFSEGPGSPASIGEEMISEGIADSFSQELFHRATPFPWDRALSASEERKLWRTVQPLLERSGPPALLRKWTFGGGDIPRSVGYTIGFHIVQGYLDTHEDVTAADLTLLDAAEILQGSSYSP